ncbi:hypothetical protein SEA_UZUMAKI_55 [Arthrobacter phage Uzumaki]|nr:hypothetical protein SEA_GANTCHERGOBLIN_56 [Arthrobacter phage GantcherGoblin]UVK62877.1 hypothetical protein SEA_UZUMAKI_55 [Arthrobacter phage Uzumaki]
MTETQIRYATFFVSGLAIGAGATYFITKSKLEKKYKDLADEEIASVKTTFERRAEERAEAKEEEFVSEVTDADMFPDTFASDADLFDKPEVLTEAETIQYNKIVTNYRPKDSPLAQKRSPEAPYLITAEEFMEDGIHEDEKVVLTYYDECGTIADEDDDIMEPGNVAELLGNDNLKHFGENPDDVDTIHIRNEAKGLDYEIVRNQLSYAEVVLGVRDEEWDTEQHPNRKRPRKMRDDE